MYRRFDQLSARNLAYYQSALSELAALQYQFDLDDATDSDQNDKALDIQHHSQNWLAFEKAGVQSAATTSTVLPLAAVAVGATSPTSSSTSNVSTALPSVTAAVTTPTIRDQRWCDRHKLAMRIRTTLREYREALLQEHQLLAIQHPNRQTMAAFANWFHDWVPNSTSKSYLALTGASASLYPLDMTSAQLHASDIISLAPQQEPDLLTRFFKRYLSDFFRHTPSAELPQYNSPTIHHIQPSSMRSYSYSRLNFTVSLITTIFAASMLFVPIYTLHYVSQGGDGRTNLRLGLIAMVTVLFAVVIVLTTNARRAEVFGSCAAYAAVLVVFISGDFGAGAAGG